MASTHFEAVPELAADAAAGDRDLIVMKFGGTSVAALAAAGLVDEHRAGTIDQLTRMLITTPLPWCSTNF